MHVVLCLNRLSYIFWLGLLRWWKKLVGKRALMAVRNVIFEVGRYCNTWNARLIRKTRSYASFGGRRLSAAKTVSDSSGIRSSALLSDICQPYCAYITKYIHSAVHCFNCSWDICGGRTSNPAFCILQHRRTSWQLAASTSSTKGA